MEAFESESIKEFGGRVFNSVLVDRGGEHWKLKQGEDLTLYEKIVFVWILG